ncbi:hypothetical protein AB0M46_21520 [Dactylosporangium sp. NPDC051485]|uniref:hypothetical protein n=1 Tax=Dactylosporangium sp. NPDC051485 TaxID=3154846 RepID=UPI0034420B8F
MTEATSRQPASDTAGPPDADDATLELRTRIGDLHAAGRCAEAHLLVPTAVDEILAGPAAPTTLAAVAALFAMLESCHEHDDATAVVAQLVPDGPDVGVLPLIAAQWEMPPGGFAEHTDGSDRTEDFGRTAHLEHASRHHADVRCSRPDCPLPRGGSAFAARWYAAVLSGHDPATAGRDASLELLAARFTGLPDADRQTTASAAQWADYLCRCAVARAALLTGSPPFTADGATPADTDPVGDGAGKEAAARLAITVMSDAGHLMRAAATRVRLARLLHRHGRCDDALTEADEATGTWRSARPAADDRNLTLAIRIAALYDACHRHDEAQQILDDLNTPDPALLPDPTSRAASGAAMRWLMVLEESRIAAAAHARLFHPDQRCEHRRCRQQLTVAADLPHLQLLRVLLPLHQQRRSTQLLPALAAHLTGFDPAISQPGMGLVGLAVMYVLNAVTDPVSQEPDIVFGWAGYACRAATDETQAGRSKLWVAAQTALLHAAVVYDTHERARDHAVAAAGELLAYYTRPGADDAVAAVNARVNFAAALHTAGRCAEAADHVHGAWRQARHLHADDPTQRRVARAAGNLAAALLGACHHHRQAVDILAEAAHRFPPLQPREHTGDVAGPDTAGQDTVAEPREPHEPYELHELQVRGDRHSAEFHPDSPCAGGRHAAHIAATLAVVTAATAGTAPGGPAAPHTSTSSSHPARQPAAGRTALVGTDDPAMTTARPHRRFAIIGIAAVTLAVPTAFAVAFAGGSSQPTNRGAAPAAATSKNAGSSQQNPCEPARSTSPPSSQPSESGQSGATGNAGAASPSAPGAMPWLAGGLVPAPEDASTGQYTLISFREWAADLAGNGPRRGTVTEVVEDHTRVIAADGSGHETITRYPAGTTNPSPGAAGARTRTEHRDPGGFRDGIAPPISSDPDTLAAQIDVVQPWENGPFAGIRAIADTATSHVLPCRTRAAALHLLASRGGRDGGTVTDRAGRTGTAITVDSGDGAVRDILIIDRRTGVILAYEMRLLRNPGRLKGQFPRTENYVLLLASHRSTTPALATPMP